MCGLELHWISNKPKGNINKRILSWACGAFESSSWPKLLSLKIFKLKLLILIWNRQKVPDGILEVETLHVLLSLPSLFSHLSLAYSTQRLNLALPGSSLSMHYSWRVCWCDSEGWHLPLSYRRPGSLIFPLWEKSLCFTDHQLILGNQIRWNAALFFFLPSLTKRWVPWDCVRSVVRREQGLHVAEHQLPVYNQGTLSESGIFTALKGVKAWFQFCSTCRYGDLGLNPSIGLYGK